MVDISVVLPAYNEAAIVGGSLRRLAEFLAAPGSGPWTRWEILLVDDGSADGTPEVARRALPDAQRLGIHAHGANRGKGAAVRTGLMAAAGEIVIVTDVDLSYGLPDIERMARALGAEGGLHDMVTGDRRHPEARLDLALSALGHVMWRQTLSAAFNVAVRLAYGLPWRDTQCGLKGFRREAAQRIARRLLTEGFLADIEMFLIAGELGLKVTGIPVHLTYLSADSTVNVVRSLPRVARDAWEIKRHQVRGGYAREPGVT